MRDSFVMYTAYMEQMELLTMEQRGVLITAILAYQAGSQLPEMDAVVKMAFAFIKARLDTDNAKWEEAVAQRKKAGQASAEARKRAATESNEAERKSTVVDSVERKATNSTVYVNESVNEIVIEKDKKTGRFTPPTVEEVRAYCFEKGYTFDPESFVAFYKSKGWKVGNAPMKDWKACCVTWSKRKDYPTRDKPKKWNFDQHDYNDTEIERKLLAMQG